MVNIEAFKGKIRSGVARPNKFEVMFSSPALQTAGNTLSVLCESVELPGASLATTEDKLWGSFRKMPYINMFNDITLTFICDNDMSAKTAFDAWQGKVVSKDGFLVGYYYDYVGTMNVRLLAEYDPTKVLYEAQCSECYPIEVISQQLAYDNNDTYLKVEVRMAYRYWTKV